MYGLTKFIFIHFVVLLLALVLLNFHTQSSYDCKSLFAYYIPTFSSDCYFNPHADKNTSELLKLYFEHYFETYEIRTEDGYDLTLFRIKNPKSRGVIVLYHSMTVDSFVWIGQNNESLAIKLFDLGYEVWLPNTRGTLYSTGHANLTIDDPEYWNFTFHEVGLYDIDAITKFVQKKTNRSDLIAIGESFATTTFLAYASLKPEESKNAYKLMIHMAMVGYMNHIHMSSKFIFKLFTLVKPFLDDLNVKSWFRHDSRATKIISSLVRYSPTGKLFCHFFLKLTFGWSKGGVDPKFYNSLFYNSPKAISFKSINHYYQIYDSGKFQMYDYGKERNIQIYGQSNPLEYPLQNISTKMFVVYSDKDPAATTQDNKYLFSKLQKGVLIGEHQAGDINHMEYFFGKKRYELALNKIIDVIKDNMINVFQFQITVNLSFFI